MTILSYDEPNGITVPVLYIAGENEKKYSVSEAVKRLHSKAPMIETEVVPNAGHCLISKSKNNFWRSALIRPWPTPGKSHHRIAHCIQEVWLQNIQAKPRSLIRSR